MTQNAHYSHQARQPVKRARRRRGARGPRCRRPTRASATVETQCKARSRYACNSDLNHSNEESTTSESTQPPMAGLRRTWVCGCACSGISAVTKTTLNCSKDNIWRNLMSDQELLTTAKPPLAAGRASSHRWQGPDERGSVRLLWNQCGYKNHTKIAPKTAFGTI